MTAIDVSYQIAGNGPPVYMIHGIGSRKTTWDAMEHELKAHFTCISYDLRGHGDSPVATTPYTLEQMVADLEALRGRLGHEQIHVIGPAYARAYPHRILSLGLLSTAAGRTEADREKLKAVGDAMQEKGIMPIITTLVERWYTDDFISRRPDLVEMRIRQVADTPGDVFLSVFDLYATTEMAPWLNEITCPCLVLTGALDGGCNPRLNRFIDRQLANSTLVIVAGLKHSILVEAPQRIIPPVKTFLLQQPGCRPGQK